MSKTNLNVLLLTDDYLPESTRNHAKMMHQLAREFSSHGHRVVVLTPGASNQDKLLEVQFIDDVEVWRFRACSIRGQGKAWRAINETMLPVRAIAAILISRWASEVQFDLCVNYSPTIFSGLWLSTLGQKGRLYI